MPNIAAVARILAFKLPRINSISAPLDKFLWLFQQFRYVLKFTIDTIYEFTYDMM